MLAPASEALFGEGALLRVNLLAVARFGSFAAELEEATGRQVGVRREGTSPSPTIRVTTRRWSG